jgi:DHA1 family bicyclomycin/chloramphenicol resistance-like MFS transporter
LLGATQFGLGAVVAPVVGVLGNHELAMAVVMAAGVIIALVALLLTGVHRSAKAEPAADGAAVKVV